MQLRSFTPTSISQQPPLKQAYKQQPHLSNDTSVGSATINEKVHPHCHMHNSPGCKPYPMLSNGANCRCSSIQSSQTPSPLACFAAALSLYCWLLISNHLSFRVYLYHSDSICSPTDRTAPRGSFLSSVFYQDDVVVLHATSGGPMTFVVY
jgi:hypothetical protein